jgi:hypothetical protein
VILDFGSHQFKVVIEAGKTKRPKETGHQRLKMVRQWPVLSVVNSTRLLASTSVRMQLEPPTEGAAPGGATPGRSF